MRPRPRVMGDVTTHAVPVGDGAPFKDVVRLMGRGKVGAPTVRPDGQGRPGRGRRPSHSAPFMARRKPGLAAGPGGPGRGVNRGDTGPGRRRSADRAPLDGPSGPIGRPTAH